MLNYYRCLHDKRLNSMSLASVMRATLRASHSCFGVLTLLIWLMLKVRLIASVDH